MNRWEGRVEDMTEMYLLVGQRDLHTCLGIYVYIHARVYVYTHSIAGRHQPLLQLCSIHQDSYSPRRKGLSFHSYVNSQTFEPLSRISALKQARTFIYQHCGYTIGKKKPKKSPVYRGRAGETDADDDGRSSEQDIKRIDG